MSLDDKVEEVQEYLFIEPRYIKTNSDHQWREIKQEIPLDNIRSHFEGEYYVGPIARDSEVDFMMFDLDRHNGESRSDLVYRYDQIEDVYGSPSIAFQTPNDGVHLYYFLDDYYLPGEIESAVTTNITLERSRIELFPGGNGWRLFAGKDMPLLNDRLYPVKVSLDDTLGLFFDAHAYEEKTTLEIPAPVRTPSTKERRIISKYTPTDIQILLEEGLQAPNSRNDALMTLTRFFKYFKGCSDEEAEHYLGKWIAEKNNGLSNDWNRNPRGVYRHIKGILKCYDPHKMGDVFPHHLVGEEDRERLEQISSQLTISFEWLLDLAAYIKKNTNEHGLVEIPFQVLRDCQGGATRNKYLLWKDKLLERRYLIIARNYSVHHGKCRMFKSKLL